MGNILCLQHGTNGTDGRTCGLVNRILQRCSGNISLDIKEVFEYLTDIKTFLLENNVVATLSQLLELILKEANPVVKTAELKCECQRQGTSPQDPYTCTETVNKNAASTKCSCTNDATATNANCKIQVSCANNEIAVGGRCDNQAENDADRFYFKDVGFGIPNVAGIPQSTHCNAQVSTSDPSVEVTAYAYCKKNPLV